MIAQAPVRARRSAELCWWAIEERIREVFVETSRVATTCGRHRQRLLLPNQTRLCKLVARLPARRRDVRSRPRESKRQDEAIRAERREVILTTRRSERVRFCGTALPQSAIAPCCPCTNNPLCRRRLKHYVETPATSAQAGLKKHAARLNSRGRADSVGRT